MRPISKSNRGPGDPHHDIAGLQAEAPLKTIARLRELLQRCKQPAKVSLPFRDARLQRQGEYETAFSAPAMSLVPSSNEPR